MATASAKANVNYVDPFEPADYAFNRYRHGLHPADHALGKTLPPGRTAPPKNK